jgi:hypothetical protein
MVFSSYCASDGGLSSAGHPVQPEDAPLIIPISPYPYLLEDVDAGVGEAKRVVLLIGRVEGCIGSRRQRLE